jgi:hypothetical protein
LADLLDAYGGYGVALVDRQELRLFHFHLGELIDRQDAAGEEVHPAKRGGASSGPGRKEGRAGQTRREEELTLRNMRRFAEAAGEFFQKGHVRRILLAGTEDNLSLFRGFLSKTWQSLVVGTFAASMGTRPTEVLAKALENRVQRRANNRFGERARGVVRSRSSPLVGRLEDQRPAGARRAAWRCARSCAPVRPRHRRAWRPRERRLHPEAGVAGVEERRGDPVLRED